MQTYQKVLSAASPRMEQNLAAGGGEGVTGVEVVSATGTLTIVFSGSKSSWTVKAVAGDTFRFDQGWTPTAFVVTSDTVDDAVHLRAGHGWSLRTGNATVSIPNPIGVQGLVPFLNGAVTLDEFGDPVTTSMIKDESEQGTGPWVPYPLRTYSTNGLVVEQRDSFEGFQQSFGAGVQVNRDVTIYGMTRVTFSLGTPLVQFADQINTAIPIYKLGAGWVATGIANGLGTYLVPTQGVGTLRMTQDAASGDIFGQLSYSPRPLTVPA